MTGFSPTVLQTELITVSCSPSDLSDSSYALARLILEASDREQRLIGQELHDGVCQELAGIAFLMQSMQRKIESSGSIDADEAAEVTTLLCKAVSHARGLSHGLYPVAPEANGLRVALQRLAEDMSDAHGVRCRFRDCPGEANVMLDEFAATNLFRIAQELLRIAIHFGKASAILIVLQCSPACMRLSVLDDAPLPASPRRLRETDEASLVAHRVRLIGATLTTTNDPQQGTRVECVLPIESR
jgi:signal transduction histidine kinase